MGDCRRCGRSTLRGMTSAASQITRTWPQLAADQDTVLTRWQARYRGMSEDAWQWKLDKRLWTPILPGIVDTHSGEVTPRQQRWAARLRIGQDGALIGDAALVELGFRLKELPVIDVGLADRPAGKAAPMLSEGPLFRPRSVQRAGPLLDAAPGAPAHGGARALGGAGVGGSRADGQGCGVAARRGGPAGAGDGS